MRKIGKVILSDLNIETEILHNNKKHILINLKELKKHLSRYRNMEVIFPDITLDIALFLRSLGKTEIWNSSITCYYPREKIKELYNKKFIRNNGIYKLVFRFKKKYRKVIL